MSVFEQIVKTRHIPHWLFDKGTRVVEVLNSLFLIGFATTFINDFDIKKGEPGLSQVLLSRFLLLFVTYKFLSAYPDQKRSARI